MRLGHRLLNLLFALALALPVALLFPDQAQAQTSAVRFQNLSVADGLSQSTVMSILQDRQGFMWFGTDDGLNKYNGYTFSIYRHDPNRSNSLIDNSIHAIYEDRLGNLWVGTSDGLELYDQSTNGFIHFRNNPDDPLSLYGSVVNEIIEDSLGNLWVGTNGGLNLLDREARTFTRFLNDPRRPASLSEGGVTALYEDAQGELWVGTQKGLDRLERLAGTFAHYRHQDGDPNSLINDNVRSIVEDQRSFLWVATAGGLSRLDGSRETFAHFTADPLDARSLATNDARVVLVDSAGRLWVGTRLGMDLFDETLGRFNHNRYDSNDPQSLGNDLVYSLYEDRTGTLWVGTFGGVSRYNRTTEKFALYQHRANDNDSLSDNVVYSIFEDLNGSLWVGTMDGGLNRLNRRAGTNTVYKYDPEETNSIGSNEVRAIFEDSTSSLWVGTAGGGLNRFDNRTDGFIHYWHDPEDPTSLSDNTVRVIYEDRLGNLWVGTRSGGLNQFNRATGGFKRFLANPANPFSISDNDVRALAEDRAGRLWVGTQGGIDVLSRGGTAFTHYRNDPQDPASLSNDRVLCLYEDSTGFMWVGTLLGGLDRFDPRVGTFTHFNKSDGLPNDTVYGILEDNNGYLWLSTNGGLSRFDPQTASFRNYDISDGLQSNEFNPGAYYQSATGEMFFGGIQGFNAFFPNRVRDNTNAPPVVVTAYNKANQVLLRDATSQQSIRLAFPDNFISFEFAALDYNAPAKNQYAYKMDGFDTNWVMAGNRRYTSYTNLEGGTYSFRVIGSNNDGVWNEQGVAVKVVVVPPFWETGWFTGLATVLVVAGVLGGYRLRIRRIQAQTRQLEMQVAERTHEIERRRVVAEGLRDILAILNSNRSLKESLDYIVSQIVRLMNADLAMIARCQSNGCFGMVASNQPMEPNGKPRGIPTLPEWLARSLKSGQPVTITDLASLPEIQAGDSLLGARSGSVLAVPMFLNDRVEGGLVLIYLQARVFSDEELKTVATFADHAALAIANAELRSQAEELAVATERSRLARDLHDAVTQTLFATSLIAEVVPRLWERNPDEGKRKLDEVRELTRGALAEMRTLLMELRPTALVDVPIYDLLQQLSDAFRGRARVPVKLVADRNILLPGEVQVGFYRIAQEALNNVFKHSHATNVEVSLNDQMNVVTLYIADNGVGFDPRSVGPDHFGLGIMEERAQSVGAEFALDAAPGRGTRIWVRWQRPLDG